MSLDLRPQVAAGNFQAYHFMMETLLKYEVECTQDENGELLNRYYYGNGVYKECRPFSVDKNKKWRFINPNKQKVPPLFGSKQLPPEGELVVITGGEKDVMAFDSFNIHAICLQNETARLFPELINELSKRFKIVAICYDNDETGQKFAKKWSEKFGIARIELPADLEGKDIYDFKSSGGTKEELYEIIATSIKVFHENKSYFTGKEVLESMKSNEFIIEGILPKSNLVGLIGGSDSGKSLLLMQFGVCYILNKPFLNLEVNGGKKVLFCSFEDDKYSIKKRLGTLYKKFNTLEKVRISENIFFELDPENIEQKIELHLENHPDTGIIIIDPLTEVLQGADINNASSIRERMQFLKKIASKYDLAVVFINHISKSSEDTNKLNKSNSIGSHAIEAKSRVMFEMKKRIIASTTPIVELGIVKGNDIDEKFKASGKRLCLKMDSESLWFHEVDFSVPENPAAKEIDWALVFGENKIMKTHEITTVLMQEYSLSEKQAEKAISAHLKIYRIERGIYQRPDFNK